MTDYNDGNWHTPNGGECPVDDATEVEVVWLSIVDGLPVIAKSTAKNVQFMDPEMIAFRVVKRAPREFWINSVGGHHRIYRTEPDRPHGYTHVREVIE